MDKLSIVKKIKIELIKRNINQADIGRRLGVSKNLVNMTIHGATKNGRVRKEICRITDLPMSIWEDMDKKEAA